MTSFAKIRLLVLDFDGVMTDNTVLVLEDGREAVSCSRSDGLGIEMLRKSGFEIIVISKESNPVVSARCRKLQIECIQGVDDKLTILSRYVKDRGLHWDEVAYVGNDINDLPCLEAVGLPIAVKDSYPEVLKAARYKTKALGGRGAVREVCDKIRLAQAKGKTR